MINTFAFNGIDPSGIYINPDGTIVYQNKKLEATIKRDIAMSPALRSTNTGDCTNGSCPGSDNLNCSNASCPGANNYGQC